jgi:hypothetical protein
VAAVTSAAVLFGLAAVVTYALRSEPLVDNAATASA